MKLESIQFVQTDIGEGELGAQPSLITVTLSLTEAVVIASVFGSLAGDYFTKRDLPEIEAYNDLCGDVFNCYWEDGLVGAMRDVRDTWLVSEDAAQLIPR